MCLAARLLPGQPGTLSLRPGVGLEFPMNHVYQAQVDERFRYNSFPLYPNFSLALQYQINDRLDVFTGWNNGATGYSFSLFCPDGRCKIGHTTLGSTQRFPLGFHWELKNVWWFPIEKRLRFLNKTINADERLLYLVLFRLKATAGVSYNYLSRNTGEDEAYNYITGNLGNTITHQTVPHVLNRHAISVFGGFTLQFYNYRNDRVQLSILYNQGIVRQLVIPLTYTINGEEYIAQLGSRGSYFIASLSYPIRLARLKQTPD